ncbi:DUF1631 domain-containing protein [Marinobacter salinisoli]|uniref:DUF1631 domain-containing protein n=1 Tax=Marinobacter salinisoli TaxID=2769486 RepID=A0ABX7MS12_9GAMM|nr:DUF1631 domain-containing protein [Marinobacter salinisoli]QSP94220.1 DUF1631 domain-containing protein [Marinobacter salinisoli]
MAQKNNIVQFADRKPSQNFLLPTALVRLRDASGRSLQKVLANFFDRSDDVLFELADRAESNRDQSAYFDAMRELRLRRKSMVVSILQYVSQAFNELGKFKPLNPTSALEEIDSDAFDTADQSELEQQVAIENLINKLHNRYEEQIRLLCARVNHLVPSIELADCQMPLSPQVICGGVSEACSDLDIDIRAKLVVLKLFDRLLADTLGDFYQEANRTLTDQGVLPDLKQSPVTRKAKGAQSAAGPSATFSELTELLHQHDDAGDTAMADGVLDTSSLMVRLSEAQADDGQWGPEQVITLSELLGPILNPAEGEAVSVGQVDQDVINLVSMLFDFMLDDRQLHPVMKAQISRLQIPVLKVALKDKNFFNRGGHPTRKLLNELALAGVGWQAKTGGQKDPLREKIESIVRRVLEEYADDISLFDELLEDFSRFLDLDRRRRELVEQRLRDAEEAKARKETSGQEVQALIERELADRDVPPPILELLRNPWTRYLQSILLRGDENSERWAQACRLTEKLVWTVDPRPVSDRTRSELLRAIPAVVDGLRKALQEISWDPFAADAAIRELELAHGDVFQRLVVAQSRQTPQPDEAEEVVEPQPGVEVDQPVDAQAPARNDKTPDTVSANAGEATKAQPQAPASPEPADDSDGVAQAWFDKADSLRVGSWIELTVDGNRVRCKLAAFIRATGKYIFVNRNGTKVAEYYREDLAAAMANGDVGMLDDGLIFDRALESIIDNLRSNRKD